MAMSLRREKWGSAVSEQWDLGISYLKQQSDTLEMHVEAQDNYFSQPNRVNVCILENPALIILQLNSYCKGEQHWLLKLFFLRNADMNLPAKPIISTAVLAVELPDLSQGPLLCVFPPAGQQECLLQHWKSLMRSQKGLNHGNKLQQSCMAVVLNSWG